MDLDDRANTPRRDVPVWLGEDEILTDVKAWTLGLDGAPRFNGLLY
jgi:hypothetical protein